MCHENFTFKGANGQNVFVWRWSTADKPLGILIIFHGMAEHAERYDDFACHMNKAGIAVYAADLRGHGVTGEINKNSCHLDNGGFKGIVEDQRILSKLIKKKFPEIPQYILGHSFGSFIAQEYIKHYGNDISGVILSGSCLMKGASIKAAYVIAAMSLMLGRKRPNKVIDRLSFGSYNKAIENPKCKFSWLSRDENMVEKYNNDSLCGNVMSTNFSYYFFKGLNRLYYHLNDIPKELPIYIMSGSDDPVGNYGLGVTKLYKLYQNLGIQNLKIKLYPGGRHEMLNELNREEVYSDISAWLLEFVQKK